MRLIQVIDALDFGDAVSTHVIEYANTLTTLGISNTIYSLYSHEHVSHYREPIEELSCSKDDVILYHFSGKSSIERFVRRAQCKKVLIYHNITPEHFFEGMDRHYEHCRDGRRQLRTFVGTFDGYVGVSDYNTQELRELGCSPCYTFPIFVNSRRANGAMKPQLRLSGHKIIFVGRVAPNKRHEDIIDVFDYYFTYIDPTARLFLIGNYADYEPYYRRLLQIARSRPSGGNIVFTGKVSDEQLATYYRTADLFLCLSEHEGFCVPIIESMANGVPTFAYDSGAIQTTMGGAGVLLHGKSPSDVAELIDIVLNDSGIVDRIVQTQYARVDSFLPSKRADQIEEFIRTVVFTDAH